MRYPTLWDSLVALIIAVGVGAATLVWSPLVPLAAVALTSLVAFMILELVTDFPPFPARPQGGRVRRQLGRALTFGAGVVALATSVKLSPPVTLALVLILGLTSPAVVGRVRRLSVRPGPMIANPAGRPFVASAVVKVEDDRLGAYEVGLLCTELRRTFWALQETPDPAGILRLVAHRQRLIDELTRRDPQAMAEWLRSGARASGSPEKYFHADPGSGSVGAG